MSWLHRGGVLQLVLVLPDGSKSLMPAASTDLKLPEGKAHTTVQDIPSTAPERIGAIADLLRACTVVAGLLHRECLTHRAGEARPVTRVDPSAPLLYDGSA